VEQEKIERMPTELQIALGERFGEHRVDSVTTELTEFPLLLLDLEQKSPVKVLMTNGLSNFAMPVPEKHLDQCHIELYFCLPSYWSLDDLSDLKSNWVFSWIGRLASYIVEKNTWFGHGHTMPCGREMNPLSETMRQNHFFLSDPMLLERELSPLNISEKQVHFLAIIPIFPDEMDYKQGKGTFKFQYKLIQHGVTEKLDDYRGTVLRSKWRLMRK
jgi:hypothetical protein